MGIFIIHYNSESDTDEIVGGSKTLRGAIKKAMTFDRQHYDDREVHPEPTEEEISSVIDNGQNWSSSKMSTKGYVVGTYIVYEIELFD